MAHRISNAKKKIEHVFFVETAQHYPAGEKLKRLEETHVLLGVRTGPDLQGFPMRRMRYLGAGVNRAMMVWCGPDPDLVEQDFYNKFHRDLTLTGAVYLAASEDEIFDYACSLLASKKKEIRQEFDFRKEST